MRTYLLRSIFISALLSLFLSSFSQDALFPIEEKGKYGFINKTGKVVITPQFEFAESFSEGMAAVSVGGKRGFIDAAGKIIIAAQYDKTTPFSEGMASGKRRQVVVL